MRVSRLLLFTGFLIAITFLVGCGGLAEVRGTVKYDGKLIEDGAIRFEPVDGKSQPAGGLIKAGAYSAKVPHGAMKVTISSSQIVDKKKLYDAPNSPYGEITAEALPEKYSDMMKTQL